MKRRLRARVTLFALAMTVALMGVFITARTWSQSENQPETPEVNWQHQPQPPVHYELGPRGEPDRRFGERQPWLTGRLGDSGRGEGVTDLNVVQPTGAVAITPQTATTFVVDSTGDDPDAFPGDGICNTDLIIQAPLPGECTLRAAIMEANASVGAVEILFDAALMNQTILPQSALPTIAHDETTIDALKDPSTGNQRPFPSAFLTVSGASAGAADGFTIQANSCTIRGLAINQFTGNGIEIASGTGNVVTQNMIGTDRDGTTDLGNTGHGVFLDVGATTNTIGPDNTISGNNSRGVFIASMANNNTIQGNTIGTNASGTTDLGNSSSGIEIGGGVGTMIQDNLIAYNGTGPIGGNGILLGSGTMNTQVVDNEIRNNTRDGVTITGSVSTGNRISQNKIFANGTGTRTLGIDLVGSLPYSRDGTDTNDTGDGDTGPNNQQNFPVLGPITVSNNSATIPGTLNSTPMTTFTLEFFSNSSNDPSGFGEGENFLGSTTVTTDINGDASFEFISAPTVPSGHQLFTATATEVLPNNLGNTSEFAQNVSGSSITVQVPNGGETWVIGSSKTIQWTSSSVSGNVKIELSRDGGSTFQTLFASTPNDNSQSWIVTGPATTQARIKISSVSNPSVNDLSNGNFAIATQLPSASITVTVPNGSENWQINTSQTIQWSSSGVTGNVNIELSRDGGATFETLVANTPNDGSQSWTVTGPASSNCLMKISSVDDPSVNDLSDAAFTISNPPGASITVLVPNGGESWPIGSVQTIQWTSSTLFHKFNSGKIMAIARKGRWPC